MERRSLWINLCLANLCIVAFYGFTLRSKILFPLPFIDFRSMESAHSHFAFAGWAGLMLITLYVYDILPQHLAQKKIYQWLLAGIETSSLGMAFSFPFVGYNAVSVFFSTLYVAVVMVFVPVFIRDLLRSPVNKSVRLLSISALLSLVLSFLGTVGLVYILAFQRGGSLLYRDSIYTFLHFQYNGFFTLSVFALFFNALVRKGVALKKEVSGFAISLCLSIIPALFLSLLWHNNSLFYVLAAIGCIFILAGLWYLSKCIKTVLPSPLYTVRLARTFWYFSVISFILKMLLQVGTIFPQLANEIYGDRPVIIGFLHLVFLGFLSFFILSLLVQNGYFSLRGRLISFPLVVFSIGIFANEFFLGMQGLSILFKTNSDLFKWLLWGAAIILVTGALLIMIARLYVIRSQVENKKAAL